MTWRFNRWHHHVDYKPFKKNALIRTVDARWRERLRHTRGAAMSLGGIKRNRQTRTSMVYSHGGND